MSRSCRRRLVLVPGCGLCNRLQALVCGQLAAEDTGRDFHLNWVPEGSCGAQFSELFAADIPALDELPSGVRCYSSMQRHLNAAPRRYHDLLQDRALLRFGRLRADAADTVAVFTCHQFLNYFHDPRFGARLRELLATVRPAIAARVAAFAQAHFDANTVGVHVRRGDWRTQRDPGYYLRAMQAFPDATFFVCSDDPQSVAQLRVQVPNVVTFPHGSLRRDEPAAIADALAEVLLLARTRYLIGTPGSSFSAIARVAGAIPGNFDYGLSISMRDFRLGNLQDAGSILWRRLRRHAGA